MSIWSWLAYGGKEICSHNQNRTIQDMVVLMSITYNAQTQLKNHLKERLLDQAQARASYTPLFGGHSRSIPQGMIFDVQPLVKSFDVQPLVKSLF